MSPYGTLLYNQLKPAIEVVSLQDRNMIDSIEGLVLVKAPIGKRMSGILALRTGNLLSQSKAIPENILCISNSDAANSALKKKLEMVIGSDASKINTYTLQAFCGKVIQDNFSIFENRSISPLSTIENIRVYKSIIESFPKNHPLKRYRNDVFYEINNLKTLFSWIKREGLSTSSLIQSIDILLSEINTETEKNISFQTGFISKEDLEKLRAGISEFDHYQNLLQANNRYEQDDLITMVAKAFEQNNGLLLSYQEKFQYIQIDGYPIISMPADKLFRLLLSNVENPHALIITYPDQKREYLDSSSNTGFKNGKLIMLTNNNDPTQRSNLLNAPVLQEYNTTTEELAGITNQVYDLLQKNIDPEKIAIIYQVDEYAASLEKYFDLKNIPFYSKRTTDILRQSFIKKIIQLLRYIHKEQETPFSGDDLLFEILHFDFYAIPSGEVAGLAVEVNSKKYGNKKTSIRKLIQEKANSPRKDLFDQGIHQKIIEVLVILENLIKVVPNTSLQQLFEKLIGDALVTTYVDQSEDSDWLMQQLSSLHNFIKSETSHNPRLSLNELLEVLDIMEREKLPLFLNHTKGNPKYVQIIKAGEAIEQDLAYVFICGANNSANKREDWINIIDILSDYYRSSLPASIEVQQNIEQYNLSQVMLFGNTKLIISFAKNDENVGALVPNCFARHIITQFSPVVNNIESTHSDLTYGAKMHNPTNGPEISQADKTIIGPILQRFVMNVSALNNYLNCPLGFYYKNILRIPMEKNEAMEFGNAIHYGLEMIFKRMLGSHRVPGLSDGHFNRENPFPPVTELVDNFKGYLIEHRGHFTNEAFARRIQYGEEILMNYYANYVNKWNPVVSIERNIRSIVNGVPIKGKIDKLEFNGKEVNIVDYKSGDIAKAMTKMNPPNEDAPNGGDYWRQAVFYKILVDNYNNKNWRVASVELDFIEPDKNKEYRKEKIIIQSADITTVTQQLTEVWNKIQAQQFYTGCGRPNCYWCNFVKENKPPKPI